MSQEKPAPTANEDDSTGQDQQRRAKWIARSIIFLFCAVISYLIAVFIGANSFLALAISIMIGLIGSFFQHEFERSVYRLEKAVIARYPTGGSWAGKKIRDLGRPRNLGILIIVLVIALVVSIFRPGIEQFFSNLKGSLQPAPTATISVPNLTKNQFPDISDGRFAFDTQRPDGRLKNEAAQSLQAGNVQAALSDWQLALKEDPTDAEAQIDQENQLILSQNTQHFTLVVAVSLTSDAHNSALLGTARDTLQGVYVEQEKYNVIQKQLHHPLAVVLIANVRSSQTGTSASQVAKEIIRAQREQAYGNIVGVIGWPPGSDEAVQALSQAQIPMVSPAPLSDALLDTEYLFSVAPSLATEAQAEVAYSIQTWHPTQSLLIEDLSDPYSSALATDLSSTIYTSYGSSPTLIPFTTGYPDPLCSQIQQYLDPPTVIYFTGYPDDVQSVLACTRLYPTVHVIGGDVLYQRIHSVASTNNAFDGLVFTAFAYPDTIKSDFVNKYAQIFGAGRSPGCIYDCIRPDNDVILGSDAALALLNACQQAGGDWQQALQPQAIQHALTQFSPAHPVDGASRQIAFASNGTPIDKTVLVLGIDNGLTKQLAAIEGS